jgi:alpha-tubulin suppressor-like RCC1 family protein
MRRFRTVAIALCLIGAVTVLSRAVPSAAQGTTIDQWGKTHMVAGRFSMPTPVPGTTPSGVTFLDAANTFNLAIDGSTGEVWGWGANQSGQLGNGTTNQSLSLTQVVFPKSPAPVITSSHSGASFAVALDENGNVWGWGNDGAGSLCDGKTTMQPTPEKLTNLPGHGVAEVAAGGSHSLFLLKDGSVWACGNNEFGQLGNGTTTSSTTPVQVLLPAGMTVAHISAGNLFSTVLSTNGEVWDWGYNQNDQLGNVTPPGQPYSDVPVQVQGLGGVDIVAINSGGNNVEDGHTMALDDNHNVWTWGDNASGQLGNDTTTNSDVAVEVTGLPPISQISAGGADSMALDTSGHVWIWGDNAYDELGNGTSTNSDLPGEVMLSPGEPLSGVGLISAGSEHNIAQ